MVVTDIFRLFSGYLCGLPSAEQRVTSEVGARDLSQERVAMPDGLRKVRALQRLERWSTPGGH